MSRTKTYNEHFWVCVMEIPSGQFRIKLIDNIRLFIAQHTILESADEKTKDKLVFIRRFDDIIAALGFRNLLISLPRRSIINMVTISNPKQEDLINMMAEKACTTH